jgi:hypothetical protein
MTEYLQPFIEAIDERHQITHLLVPNIGAECISEEFKKAIKDAYGINITTVPFNSDLFPPNINNGLYLLIDCMYKHIIMAKVGRIQTHIRLALTNYKLVWTLSFLSKKQHKWEGKIIR